MDSWHVIIVLCSTSWAHADHEIDPPKNQSFVKLVWTKITANIYIPHFLRQSNQNTAQAYIYFSLSLKIGTKSLQSYIFLTFFEIRNKKLKIFWFIAERSWAKIHHFPYNEFFRTEFLLCKVSNWVYICACFTLRIKNKVQNEKRPIKSPLTS